MATENQSVGNADQLSHDSLFQQAMAPDTPAPAEQPSPAPAQPAAPEPQPGEPARDERGRFASPQPQPEAQAPTGMPQPQPQPGAVPPPQPADDGGQVPSGRLRELREDRDREAERARNLEFALYDQQRQLRELQAAQVRAQQAQQPPQIPDIITDPQGYHQYVESRFTEQLRNQEANFSFRIAHDRHGEMFENAYGEMIHRAERGDRSVVQAVMQSPDPGAAMMNWFRREVTLAKVGNDPDKWFEAQLVERLKNQKFAGSVMDYVRGQTATQQQQTGGGPVVQLPPSLNNIAASAHVQLDGDMSDSSLFDYAFRQGRTKR
jgi:hypothetical protein